MHANLDQGARLSKLGKVTATPSELQLGLIKEEPTLKNAGLHIQVWNDIQLVVSGLIEDVRCEVVSSGLHQKLGVRIGIL